MSPSDDPDRARDGGGSAPGGPAGDTLRTFVAVFPPAPVLEALGELRRRLEPDLPGLRWTAPANLHYTLRFFGDLTPEEADRAGEVLTAVAAVTVPFELELAGLGVFPKWNRPRVLWVGCGRGGVVLEALARTLERGFRESRLGRADKPFRAHLTLGRWRDSRDLDLTAGRARCEGETVGASFRVGEAAVVKSTLHPRGSIYEPLHTARFGANPG